MAPVVRVVDLVRPDPQDQLVSVVRLVKEDSLADRVVLEPKVRLVPQDRVDHQDLEERKGREVRQVDLEVQVHKAREVNLDQLDNQVICVLMKNCKKIW